ncbi:hypothetical protein DFAR_660003 [Desulfarculales bacterium]
MALSQKLLNLLIINRLYKIIFSRIRLPWAVLSLIIDSRLP